ncbi:MAG: DUF5715 family protein [Acidobacteriaceae bacterium]
MRISPFKFRSRRLTALRFAGLSLLTVLLLLPTSLFARTSQATLSRERRSRLHVSAHPRVSRRHVTAVRRRHSVAATHSARLHRHGHWTRTSRHRAEADLNNVRTHTSPVNSAAARAEDAAASASELDMAPAPGLMAPASESNAGSPANASIRDLPFFPTAVPQYMPVALRGSHEVLVHQNIIADVEGLSRIENDAQLGAMVRAGELVALPASSALLVDPRLPSNRRYCRTWTAKFLRDLSRAHEKVFGDPLQLTSAVRTIEFQRHLAHYNGNAAPAYGDTASPHLTGQAIDLGKKGMSRHEVAWMRAVLGRLQAAGKLDVEEEFKQACFHISVYKTYAPHVPLPAIQVADGEPASMEGAPPSDSAIGGLTPSVQTVSAPVQQRRTSHAHHSSAVAVRRASVRRRHRRHRAAMALLAARMR